MSKATLKENLILLDKYQCIKEFLAYNEVYHVLCQDI